MPLQWRKQSGGSVVNGAPSKGGFNDAPPARAGARAPACSFVRPPLGLKIKMANRSGKLAKWEVNQGVQGKAIPGPNLFKPQPSYNSTQSQPGAMVPRPGQTSNFQLWTSRYNVVDKQTDSYIRTSVRESSSSGDVFKERSTGRVGFKEEQKITTTFKVGDKGGYSECQVEERYRNVRFGDGNKSSTTNSNLVKESEGSYATLPDEVEYDDSIAGEDDAGDYYGDDSDGFTYDDDDDYY